MPATLLRVEEVSTLKLVFELAAPPRFQGDRTWTCYSGSLCVPMLKTRGRIFVLKLHKMLLTGSTKRRSRTVTMSLNRQRPHAVALALHYCADQGSRRRSRHPHILTLRLSSTPATYNRLREQHKAQEHISIS